jgi:hypothetical protein
MPLLNLEKLLDRAERDALLTSATEFRFPIIFTAAIKDNPAALEDEIRRSGFLKVSRYRDEKEGFARVARPAEVSFGLGELFRKRRDFKNTLQVWHEFKASARSFDIDKLLDREYAICRRRTADLLACGKIFEHLVSHRAEVNGLLPRQIPHGESTKRIGKDSLLLKMFQHRIDLGAPDSLPREVDWEEFFRYFGLRKKPLSFRYYSTRVSIDGVSIENFQGVIDETNSSRTKFDTSRLLIVENEESFVALIGELDDVTLVLGAGRAIAAGKFLKDCFVGQAAMYWGDIDKAGYEIYASVAKWWPTIKPLLMDEEALERYGFLGQDVVSEEPREGVLSYLQKPYEAVCRRGVRIEQEQIPFQEVLREIRR